MSEYWIGRCPVCGHPYGWFVNDGVHQCPPSLTSDGPLGILPSIDDETDEPDGPREGA